MESFKINEEFLYYLWSHQLLKSTLATTDGQKLEVLHLGVRNQISGPDFSNAKLKIGGQVWFGNVEVHVKSSDWIRHNHEGDPSFESIILHIVYENDEPLDSHIFRKIPTLELKHHLNSHFISHYKDFIEGGNWIPCEKEIQNVDVFHKEMWLQRLLIERLERKSKSIAEVLQFTRGDWEQTFLITLCKAYGFKYNAIPFEQLGKNLSVSRIQKSDNIQALIFGMSGLLPANTNDFYVHKLIHDFSFLQQKWNLNSISKQSWKIGGLRPYNSPYLRLAQLSTFLETFHHGLLQEVLAIDSLKEFRKRFQCTPHEFWNNHFSFEKSASDRNARMSSNSIDLILVNAIIPFLFVYGRQLCKPEWEEKAIEMLQQLSPDVNSIINNWKKLGFRVANAANSQSLIELYQNYCSPKKCLFCTIGTKVLNHD